MDNETPLNNQDAELTAALIQIPQHLKAPKVINDKFPSKEQKDLQDNRRKKLDNDKREQDLTHQRSAYRWILWIVTIWLAWVVAVLTLAGLGWITHLSDTVMVTLLTTTTANVIGMVWLVISYLFPKKE